MHVGRLVFSQLIDHVPMQTFRRCVARYHGNRYKKSFSCLDQFLCMAFAQLTYRESLRDIEACLRAQSHKLYHMGIRGKVLRSTLADAQSGATGASTPTLLKHSSPSPVRSMPEKIWDWSWTTPSMRSMPP
jgi:hypothetical protein